jgi:hypothetical protein
MDSTIDLRVAIKKLEAVQRHRPMRVLLFESNKLILPSDLDNIDKVERIEGSAMSAQRYPHNFVINTGMIFLRASLASGSKPFFRQRSNKILTSATAATAPASASRTVFLLNASSER